MESHSDEAKTYVPDAVADDEMNWDAYAEHYDDMCDFNPSYQKNIEILEKFLLRWNLPSNAAVCDLGAGTGNYISALSRHLPNASFTHVDFDKKMNRVAAKKYERNNVKNYSIVENYAQHVEFPDNHFDLIVCVNALYAISPQKQVLHKVSSWLKSDGRFFVIDFGRRQKTLDWALYLFRESMKNHRAGQYVRALYEGREVLKQNRKSLKGQESGRYWLHSTSEFGNTLVDCGFEVDELTPCYRGYADLAICRPIK